MIGPSIPMIVIAISLFGQASAELQCFVGNQDNGELIFGSAVENSGFSGYFGRFEVEYCLGEDPPINATILVSVETGSADSDNNDRDETLLGPEFFDVEQFPVSTWISESITITADGYVADGMLELRGIRAPVAIEYSITADPSAQEMMAIGQFRMSGRAEINRQDFQVGTGEFADPEFVRNRVDVDFTIELFRSSRTD